MGKSKINNAKKKAKKALNNAGDAISNNPKTTIYAVLGIVGVILAYKLIKGTSITDNTLNLALNPSNLTIDSDQATNMAAQLLDAMNRYGTDEDLIFQVFNMMQTSDDFKYVASKFGMVNYLNGGPGSPPEGLPDILDGATPRNLVYWLRAELSPNDGEVYNKVKSMVQSAGFAF